MRELDENKTAQKRAQFAAIRKADEEYKMVRRTALEEVRLLVEERVAAAKGRRDAAVIAAYRDWQAGEGKPDRPGLGMESLKRALKTKDWRTVKDIVDTTQWSTVPDSPAFVINDATSFTVYRVGEKVVEVTGRINPYGYPMYPTSEDTFNEFEETMSDAVRAAWKEQYGED